MVTKVHMTTMKQGMRTLSGMKFLSSEITKLEPISTKDAAAPMPTAFMTLVVVAMVGQVPRTSRKVGFSVIMPLRNTLVSLGLSLLDICLYLLLFRLFLAIYPYLDELVYEGGSHVHYQYGVGNALGIASPLAYDRQYEAAAEWRICTDRPLSWGWWCSLSP